MTPRTQEDILEHIALNAAISQALNVKPESYYLADYSEDMNQAIELAEYVGEHQFHTMDDIGLLRLIHLNQDPCWRATFHLTNELDTLRHIETPYTADAATPAHAIALAAAKVLGVDVDNLDVSEYV